MPEAKISQLAKLLSAVMTYEDLPVEIHTAIADWSCPSNERVSNSPELFQLILDDSKAHPEDYGDTANVSHPKPGDGPQLVLAEKDSPQSQLAATRLTLGEHLASSSRTLTRHSWFITGLSMGSMSSRQERFPKAAQFIQAVIDQHKLERQKQAEAK